MNILIKYRIYWILFLALFLRVSGLGFGLPFAYHQDEPILINHALQIGVAHRITFYVIPPFTQYLLFCVYSAYFLIGMALNCFSDMQSFAMTYVNNPSAFFILARLSLGVFFGVGTVALLAKLAEEFFSKQVAWLASLMLAIALIHVQNSHYAYVDTAVTFSILLVVYFILKVFGESKLKYYLMAGIALGWAASIKYTALYIVPALLLIFVIALLKRQMSVGAIKGFAAATIATCISFIILVPYVVFDYTHFMNQMIVQAGAETHVGFSFHLVYSLLHGCGPLWLVLAIVGLGLIARKGGYRAWIILSISTTFYAVNACFGQHFARYILPLVPLLCLSAAVACDKFFYRQKKLTPIGRICVAVLVVSMILPTFRTLALFNADDTRSLAYEWFQDNVPENSVVIVDNRAFAPRLRQNNKQVREKIQIADQRGDEAKKKRWLWHLNGTFSDKAYNLYTLWPKTNPEEPQFLSLWPFVKDDWKEIRSTGVEYITLNYSEQNPLFDVFQYELKERATRVAFFSPFDNVSQKYPLDAYGSTAAPMDLKALYSRNRLGPYIEVYQIDKGQGS